jgi:hypothetical protein
MKKTWLVALRDINNNGLIEYVRGILATCSGMALHAEDRSSLVGWFLYALRVFMPSTADANSAFSINTATGEVYVGGTRVFTWDPTIYDIIWWFPTNTTLFTAPQGVIVATGVGQTSGTSITIAYNYNIHVGGINPNRTAINAASLANNVPFYIALCAK